jgi:hypothetical protein
VVRERGWLAGEPEDAHCVHGIACWWVTLGLLLVPFGRRVFDSAYCLPRGMWGLCRRTLMLRGGEGVCNALWMKNNTSRYC